MHCNHEHHSPRRLHIDMYRVVALEAAAVAAAAAVVVVVVVVVRRCELKNTKSGFCLSCHTRSAHEQQPTIMNGIVSASSRSYVVTAMRPVRSVLDPHAIEGLHGGQIKRLHVRQRRAEHQCGEQLHFGGTATV